jgi:hypothetical protein
MKDFYSLKNNYYKQFLITVNIHFILKFNIHSFFTFKETDEFQKQQKEKVIKKLTNKRKRTEELQKETILVCGTDIGAKRKRKPKIRDD